MSRRQHHWEDAISLTSDTYSEICTRCGAERLFTVEQDGETATRYYPPPEPPACGDEDGDTKPERKEE